jgi:acetoin utilization deacetylase AcuC-like enzyme
MQLVYSPKYAIDIGAHVFPTAKYGRVFDCLRAKGLLDRLSVVEPAPAAWAELELAHDRAYLEKLQRGRLTPGEVARLEIPWSPAIVEGFRLMTGGTLLAAAAAMDDGVAVHLGGGFHHAFADHGEGFCMFNDVAVAVEALRANGRVRRAAVVDCDVHQGNGTAAIFGDDPDVFTLSIHQSRNYPAVKPPSRADVDLANGVTDDEYLSALEPALQVALASSPDLLVYLAGADPYFDDQLGGLGLTMAGLRRRDALVLRSARMASVPVAVTLAGGYARRTDDTVAIHATTVEEAMAALAVRS